MEDTMFLIERSHHGDKEAREILVQENTGLVWSIVRRYMGRGTDSEDLFQIGIMGLIKAIDKFDIVFFFVHGRVDGKPFRGMCHLFVADGL